MRIVTYNIHKGFGPRNARFSLEGLRTALRSIDADLVFLQEAVGLYSSAQSRNGANIANPLEYLADSLWPHTAYGRNVTKDKGHYGNAILSRYPLETHENVNISLNIFEGRGLLHTSLNHPSLHQPLHLICLHLNLLETHRKQQFQFLVSRISNHVPPENPLIVAGDFNDWRERADSYIPEPMNLREGFRSLNQTLPKTFPSWLPLFCLDRIYVRGLTPVRSEVKEGSPWRHLSDHCPLIVDIAL